MLVAFGNKTTKENAARAEHIRENLEGCVFAGEGRISGEPIDKGGAIKLVPFTDIKIECAFRDDGMASVMVTESYCDGEAITINGVMVYDDVNTTKETYAVGKVSIALGGAIQVRIGSWSCSISVDDYDNPTSIVMNGIQCELQ